MRDADFLVPDDGLLQLSGVADVVVIGVPDEM
jgi:hypothetical protein